MTGIVYTQANQFRLDNGAGPVRYRPVGGNNYGLGYGGDNIDSDMDAFFAGCRKDGMTVIRTWFYNSPGANFNVNTNGNYRWRDASLPGTTKNIVLHIPNRSFEGAAGTTGWLMDGEFSRVSEAASNGSFSIKQQSAGSFQNFYTNATGLTVVPNKATTLTFRYKLAISSGLGPILSIMSGNAFGTSIANTGSLVAAGDFVTQTLTFTPTINQVWIKLTNNGGTLTGFYDDFNMTYAETTLGDMAWREPPFARIDKILATANKYGIKMILTLENNWETPWIYRPLHDAVYGTHYGVNRDQPVSLSRVGTVVTGTTTTPHELYPGCLVWMKGAVEPGFSGGGLRVQSCPTPLTFTYNSSVSGTTIPTGTTTVGRGLSNSYDVNSPTHQTLFHVPTMKQLTKDMIDKLAARVNTVDGIPWTQHPAIFAFELINEGRYDANNDGNQNQNGSTNCAAVTAFAYEQSAYIKYKFPNHMVSYGDLSRNPGYIQWPSGGPQDQWQSGSYYGVFDTDIANLWSIDYADFHMYLYQGSSGTFLKSGNGYFGPSYDFSADGINFTDTRVTSFNPGEAVRREMRWRIMPGIKTLRNKPFMITEWGVAKADPYVASSYSAYPRSKHFQQALWEMFADDCDGFLMWHYYGIKGPQGDGGDGMHSNGAYPYASYSYVQQPLNMNDDYILSVFTQWHNRLNGGRPLVEQSLLQLRPSNR